MVTLEDRIVSLDITLFDSVYSQTVEDDKRTLLLLQRSIRDSGPYTYLEIGSYVGGTIQTHYADPACERIYSIDKRPGELRDVRFPRIHYRNGSTLRMIENLATAFPSVDPAKLTTFESDARYVPLDEIADKPRLCLIDGEHTRKAALSDFEFCLSACHPDGIISFHDAHLVFPAIRMARKTLARRAIRHRGVLLADSVYVFLLGSSVELHGPELSSAALDEEAYFRTARTQLRKHRRNVRKWKLRGLVLRLPPLHRFLRSVRRLLIEDRS